MDPGASMPGRSEKGGKMKRSLLKKRKRAERIVFQLLYDYGAGEYRVRELMRWETEPPYSDNYLIQDYGFFNEIGVYDSKKELHAAIEDLKGKPVFACFHDTASDEWFVSEEDDCSGNWRGSKYDPFTCVKEFDTREEAERYIKQ